MKKHLGSPPGELDLLRIIAELVRCRSCSFHTERNERSQHSSHPGADFTAFPTVMLTVEKAKDHFLEKGEGSPYLIVRNDALEEREVFLRLEGDIEEVRERDLLTLRVTFRIKTILIKKQGTILTKATFVVD